MKRLICRLFGHRWEMRSLACTRCQRTQSQIIRDAQPDPTWDDVNAAYWRGIEDGRKVDRRRAYRLGFRRGVRECLGRVEKAFL